ncbi:MAG: DUF3098 domain-containing protein [Bacteroidales bacterium]|jgi:hypothetical protein|nr:DUF3098 domain-containing protein [Bacteroidales bacterium]MDD4213267.1 DUF3098 domain-containing protein [Bacteroidales bacterium]
MAQKRKPNIVKKPLAVDTKKADVVAAPKAEAAKATTKSKLPDKQTAGLLFDKRNYIIMLAGILLIALGFILMAGGGSDDPNVFNYDMFNTQRLTVAPILILLGFVAEVVAIMLKPKQKTAE